MKAVETDIHVKTELSCQYFLAMSRGQDAAVALASDVVCAAKGGTAVKENRSRHADSSFLVALLTAQRQEPRRDGIAVGAADVY